MHDTGSRDASISIAEAAGARISRSHWRGDFAFHRNEVQRLARGRWVLHIDADEVLVDTDIEEVRRQLRAGTDLPNILVVRNRSVGPTGKAVDAWAPRLIRRTSGIEWHYPVHEQLAVVDEPFAKSTIRLRHYGYDVPEVNMRKVQRNLDIALRMPDDEPHAIHTRMRCYSSLRDWAQVMSNAETLIDLQPIAPLIGDACVYGAAAAHRARDLERFEWFAEQVPSSGHGESDIKFIRLLRAAVDYLRALQRESAGTGDWHFLSNRFFAGLDAAVAEFLSKVGVRWTGVQLGPESSWQPASRGGAGSAREAAHG